MTQTNSQLVTSTSMSIREGAYGFVYLARSSLTTEHTSSLDKPSAAVVKAQCRLPAPRSPTPIPTDTNKFLAVGSLTSPPLVDSVGPESVDRLPWWTTEHASPDSLRCVTADSKCAIGSLLPFLGSLGAGAGGPGSHRAMQKPTRAFHLVANIASREPKGPVWLVPCASQNRLNWIQGHLFGSCCAGYLVTSSLRWWG
jgi:hypothetical protein